MVEVAIVAAMALCDAFLKKMTRQEAGSRKISRFYLVVERVDEYVSDRLVPLG